MKPFCKPFSGAEFRARAAARLHRAPPVPATSLDAHSGPSDFRLNADSMHSGELRGAAVLVPVRDAAAGVSILFTRRSEAMRTHAGQISFPGGRADEDDDGPASTALREANEEIGLPAEAVDVLGYLDCYVTRSGFCVSPVVGIVPPDFVPRAAPCEVDDVFEVPLGFLMDPRNHCQDSREIEGDLRRFVSLTFGEHYIWGATAGMLKILYERMYR